MKNSDVVLYAVGLFDIDYFYSGILQDGRTALDRLTEVSGGRAFIVKDASKSDAVNEAFEAVAKELRSQYQLSFESQTSGAKEWKEIKVKASYPDAAGQRKDLKVRTRAGFTAKITLSLDQDCR